MSYAVGETVVHPQHGPAVVEGTEKRRVAGQTRDYVVLSRPEEDLTLRVPLEACDDVGIRDTVDQDRVPEILETLGDDAQPLPSRWHRKRRKLESRLRSAEALQVASVLRDLREDAVAGELSTSERRLFEEARQRLATELTSAVDGDGDVTQRIDEILGYQA